ncbi:MAG: FKBP-type peptidyl-prolyl cis-trans isomerase [Phenylobacterium sp.]|uniref:FKBP-type peptidyl-prolyl cis-trans isomerase n=1 Tax=Phenylobacterium sp. TaxID=1871053 RepID=UPI0027189AD6|nr:FKBP-type peptidyl-prolyl cis-trans isomerase [Phenylobacterium sp.]MDO8899864.1 FKBP-type peptidyl-prolyl cis-trans isomerase [Phenylobacterium sp.]
MRVPLLALATALALAACSPQGSGGAPEAKAFMEQNAKRDGVETLESGVQYEIVRSGPADGLKPTKADEVKVHYEGKLADGEVFDSSYQRGVPAAMPLAGLIPAWLEVLPLMRPGDEWIITVPPEMGYGERGQGPIPPNSVLIFRIELIDVLPGPGRIQRG